MKPNYFTLVICLCFCIQNVFSQGVKKAVATEKKPLTTSTLSPTPSKKEKAYTIWSLKAGANLSVIYLARNVKENNNEPGYCTGLTFEINDFVRVSTLYSYFKPINIEPTWLNVRANTYESNFEILARFPNQKTLLYPFVGFSYNTFTGYFTGQSDYLNLREYYRVNSTIKNQWLGFNLGIGIEHNFKTMGLFIDYRMRVGKQEKAINIMDVCYTAGLKIKFPYGKLAHLIAKPNDRFHWF